MPTLVLADYITMPTGELLQKVTPLVANLGALSEEPCWQRTQHWPLEELVARIDAAGDARLLAKAAIMEADLDALGSADEVFYHGLMDSLGYSANREPMRALATALPISQLLTLPFSEDRGERATLLESMFLGAGGFLPSQRPDLSPLDWLSAQYADDVERLWQAYAPILGLSPDGLVASGWNIDRVRPANSPARRLAAAARLLARLLWEPGGMLGPFLNSAYGLPDELAKRWTQTLTVSGEGYWASHADFGRDIGGADAGAEAGKEEIALVGNSRASDIAVNILLPLLVAHAERNDRPDLRETALAVYTSYPKLADNKITRAMIGEAIGPHRKKAINGARRQQGLMHLYKLYCEARRCYECPVSGLVVGSRWSS